MTGIIAPHNRMASMYSNRNLQNRSDILESQLLLIRFLTADIMNTLVHLFSEDCCKNRDTHITIAQIIEKYESA